MIMQAASDVKCCETGKWKLNLAHYRPDKSGSKTTRSGLTNPLHVNGYGSVPRVQDLDMSIQAERI